MGQIGETKCTEIWSEKYIYTIWDEIWPTLGQVSTLYDMMTDGDISRSIDKHVKETKASDTPTSHIHSHIHTSHTVDLSLELKTQRGQNSQIKFKLTAKSQLVKQKVSTQMTHQKINQL